MLVFSINGTYDRTNLREDYVAVLTLSSRYRKGRNGGKTLREDYVAVLTLSSRARRGRSGSKDYCFRSSRFQMRHIRKPQARKRRR